MKLEYQTMLVSAKLTMVRYRNALQAIRAMAAASGQARIERLASVALKES